MSSTDWPRCQGGTPNRYSGSASAISQVNALATQMSTMAIRRRVARMAFSWRKESANVCIACQVSEYSRHSVREPPGGKLKVYVAGRGGIHSLDDDSI